MRQYLLPEKGNFYKANMHMHTTVSDGCWTPEQAKEEYKKRGYSIMAYTDHEVMIPHDELNDENFLTILSTEIAVNAPWSEKGFWYVPTYHINIYAKDPHETVNPLFTEEKVFPKSRELVTDEMRKIHYERHYSVEAMNEMIATANKAGFLVSYNHPFWSIQGYEDYIGLEGVWGVELANYGCFRLGYQLDNSMQPIDDLLKKDKRVFPLATDDAHNPPDCFGGFVVVKADKLEYHTVMGALERGDFYASLGPSIDELYIEDGIVHLSCSEARLVSLTTECRFASVRGDNFDKTVTSAAFDINKYLELSRDATKKGLPFKPYFRITVQDKEGRTAHTRAYFVDELKAD